MIRDLDLLYSINVLFDKRIIVYGAGANAPRVIYLLRQMGVDNIELCDSDSKKDGIIVEKVKCSLWENIKHSVTSKDAIIISAGAHQYQDEIISIIHQHDSNICIYTIWALEQSCIFNIKQLPDTDYKRHEFFDMQVKHILLTSMKTTEYYKHQLNNLKYFTFLTDEETPIVVLQPAKVGSSSVLEGLRAKNKSALHLHNIESMEYNKGDILRYSKQRKIKLITLVREPIARQISLLFQWIGMNIYNYAGAAELEAGFDIRELMSKFFGVKTYNDLLDEFEWFDREIRPVFDIDVYDYSFDKEKGYTIIEKGNVEMLLIKAEKLNSLEGVY